MATCNLQDGAEHGKTRAFYKTDGTKHGKTRAFYKTDGTDLPILP